MGRAYLRYRHHLTYKIFREAQTMVGTYDNVEFRGSVKLLLYLQKIDSGDEQLCLF